MTTINVTQELTASWILEDTSFYCQHDGNFNIETVEVDYLDQTGNHNTYNAPYITCISCGAEVEKN